MNQEHLKFLYAVSTENISKETAKMLDHPEYYLALETLPVYQKVGSGWWIYISLLIRCQGLEHLPKDLADVIRQAVKKHAERILLDRDAFPDPDLPVYEW